MGEVYRARDTRLDRDVAIKILREQLAIDPSALKRFEREAKAVAALSHPNILDIHEFDADANADVAVPTLSGIINCLIPHFLIEWPKPLSTLTR